MKHFHITSLVVIFLFSLIFVFVFQSFKHYGNTKVIQENLYCGPDWNKVKQSQLKGDSTNVRCISNLNEKECLELAQKGQYCAINANSWEKYPCVSYQDNTPDKCYQNY